MRKAVKPHRLLAIVRGKCRGNINAKWQSTMGSSKD